MKLAQPIDLKHLISTLLMGGPCYSDNLTASASFQISLLFHGLSLCQDQVAYAQSEASGRTNRHAVIKKWEQLAVPIFKSLTSNILGSVPHAIQPEDQV